MTDYTFNEKVTYDFTKKDFNIMAANPEPVVVRDIDNNSIIGIFPSLAFLFDFNPSVSIKTHEMDYNIHIVGCVW